MKYYALNVGVLGTNCYIIACDETKEAAIVDPGGSVEKIEKVIRQEGLTVKYIINTHGHGDHIVANQELRKSTGAPLMIHEADGDMILHPQKNLSVFLGDSIACEPADVLLHEGEIIKVGHVDIKVLHMPGHTPGGIALLTGDVVLVGDSLFAQSVGRTDFPGSSHSQLIKNIQEKLMILPDETKVLPGHGPETTIGTERRMNPFIQ